MAYLILLAILSEPLLISGYLCVRAYRRLKMDGRSFSYSVLDLLFLTLVISFLLWKTMKAIARYPDHRYDLDLSPLSLPLVWIGALSGMFIGRCYSIRNANDWRSAAIMVVFGALGIVGTFIVFIPWILLWMWCGGMIQGGVVVV